MAALADFVTDFWGKSLIFQTHLIFISRESSITLSHNSQIKTGMPILYGNPAVFDKIRSFPSLFHNRFGFIVVRIKEDVV